MMGTSPYPREPGVCSLTGRWATSRSLETLRTLAEIAVGFAGFASIVVAFRRQRESWTVVDGVRYRVMPTNSLAACALALLPLVLAEFVIDQGNVFGFPVERGPGPYVAGVALFLGSAGQAFFRLLVLPEEATGSE